MAYPQWFAQGAYRVRFDWGRRGAQAAAERRDGLVVVDVLRFSTAAITAVHHGGRLFPCGWTEDLAAFASRVGAETGGHRPPPLSLSTLSPRRYLDGEPGARIALASPNGATCVRYARDVPALLVGAFVNAAAAASAVRALLASDAPAVTVLACGERWQSPSEDGELRFAVEDYLGAGAILSFLPEGRSPEAEVCALAFQGARDRLETLLRECGSGQELLDKGLVEDVAFAARLDLYDTVPVMRGEALERW